jgi:alkylation response protein AidB-like acyl-CoA dehydrogenase
MRFVLERLAGLSELAALPGYEEATPDLVEAVLEEAGKLAAEMLAPLNQSGDREGARLEGGAVRTPAGFKEAYDYYRDNGWNALPFDPAYGGQGLPWALAFAIQEMWHAANMSFGVCPLLNQSAVELLQAHGNEEQKRLYLPKMIAGEWTGTMNLTEPQAGSDLSLVRSRAEPDGDGFRLFGQKVYITYGDHDLAENIVHMVLARLPDAPAGTRGISLFAVPKFLVNPDGSLGPRNDVRCLSLEHKLGMHGSPTALMGFGEDGEGAWGTLVGEPHRGLVHMFTMMNNARLTVGLQGVALAERARQQASAYAKDRVQGKPLVPGRDEGAGGDRSVPIVRHPGIRRLLMTMRAETEAARALAYYTVSRSDVARRHPDAGERARARARVDLLTPVVKAWCTETGCSVSSLGVQVHGGMGYIEETGAAQHYRDARVTPIYEGSNEIQALDLAFRKVGRDKGEAARTLIAEMRTLDDDLAALPGDDLAAIRRRLAAGATALEQATGWMVEAANGDPLAAGGAAAPYLQLFALVTGGFLMAKAAIAAMEDLRDPAADHPFAEAKLLTARFFAENAMARADGLLIPITDGHRTVMALPEDQL